MPRNSSSRFASITWSSRTNRPGWTSMRRGSSGGILTRAKRCSPVCGSRSPTAIERRERADVGERVPGVDRERREHRVDLVVEAAPERVVVLGDLVVVEDRDPLGSELPAEGREDRALLGHQLEDPGPDRVQLVRGRQAVGRHRLRAAQLLAPQARDADLEELVEIVDEEEQRPDPVEQGVALVARLVEDPRVELEPRQLAVEDRDPLVPRRPSATAAGSARTGCWANGGHGPLNDRTGPGRGRDDTSDPIPVGPPRIPRRRSGAPSDTPRSWGVPVTPAPRLALRDVPPVAGPRVDVDRILTPVVGSTKRSSVGRKGGPGSSNSPPPGHGSRRCPRTPASGSAAAR